MKTKRSKWIKMALMSFLLLCLCNFQSYGQRKREKMVVLGIDVNGVSNGSENQYSYRNAFSPAQMSNLVRLEIEKLDTFEVIDRYDANFILRDHKIKADSCFGKISALEYGKVMNADLAITGSIERYADFIVLSLRLVDVKNGDVKKTEVNEFLNLPNELQLMVRITLREMFGYSNDQAIVTRLTKQYNYENIINNPQKSKLNLSGPRMGFTAYTFEGAKLLGMPKSSGGYEAYPVMFHFGYQFEAQYLNEGNYQALFEFIPLITGMDQNLIIPSITVLNGLRSNINGWEIALGPSFNIMTMGKGFYNEDNHWVLDPNGSVQRSDSRGDYKLRSSFVIALGKSFKSGKMNIPFNAFIVPARDGICFGLSFGYNAKNK